MPIYCYQCPKCLEVVEDVRSVRDRNKPGPPCPTGCTTPDGEVQVISRKSRTNIVNLQVPVLCERSLGLEGCNTDVTDWLHPVLSDRMGVHPAQVAEHRRLHPKIPMTETGEIIVTNASEERRINKELARTFNER